MTVVRLDQLAMPPGREADAVAFHEGMLGTPQVSKPPHLAVRGGWFERGDLGTGASSGKMWAKASSAAR